MANIIEESGSNANLDHALRMQIQIQYLDQTMSHMTIILCFMLEIR